jgi:hypothetical protein
LRKTCRKKHLSKRDKNANVEEGIDVEIEDVTTMH